jgi:hypothetical protein
MKAYWGVIVEFIAITVSAAAEQGQPRRVEVLLPGVGADDKAKNTTIAALSQAVMTRALFIGPTDGQLFKPPDLFIDDGLLAHGRADNRIAGRSQRVKYALQFTLGDDDLFADKR